MDDRLLARRDPLRRRCQAGLNKSDQNIRPECGRSASISYVDNMSSQAERVTAKTQVGGRTGRVAYLGYRYNIKDVCYTYVLRRSRARGRGKRC
jgi:hypothetical protein